MNDGRDVTGGQIYADIVTTSGIQNNKEKEKGDNMENYKYLELFDGKYCYKYYKTARRRRGDVIERILYQDKSRQETMPEPFCF